MPSCKAETHGLWKESLYARPSCSDFWKVDANANFDTLYAQYLTSHRTSDHKVEPTHAALRQNHFPLYGKQLVGNLYAHLYANDNYRLPDGYGTPTGLVPNKEAHYTSDVEYMLLVEHFADHVELLVRFRKERGHREISFEEFGAYLEQSASLREGWL